MIQKEIYKKLINIAKLLKREYETEPRKTIRAIYREVSELHNKIKDTTCWNCDGMGIEDMGNVPKDCQCPDCKGTGEQPTPESA